MEKKLKASLKAQIEAMWQEPFLRRFLDEAMKNEFAQSYKDRQELLIQVENADFSKILCALGALRFHSSCVCDIELVPESIKAFFPKLIASYPITSSKAFSTYNSGKNYLTNLLGEDINTKLNGCFFKLSSRSAKDCRKIQANTIEDIADAFWKSLRIPDDVSQYIEYCGTVNLNFYEWLDDCCPTKEMRCFIFNGKLQGITKYQILEKAEYSPDFPQKVQTFVEEQVIPAAQGWLKNFVVDVYERADGSVKVLEFNPYELSDPCLYHQHSNIGKPFILEEDIYNAAKLRGLI